MDIDKYQELSGITVSSAKQAFINAQITKTRMILENMLGYSLDFDAIDTNLYDEQGKTEFECPTTIDIDNLTAADAVSYAYRIFPWNNADKYHMIDPCSEIYKVKFIQGDITVKTFDEVEEYFLHQRNGFISSIEIPGTYCLNCPKIQLAVDANWLWQSMDDLPSELAAIWTDMITYYADTKNNVKSETLGPHRYEKFENTAPEDKNYVRQILQKYIGANGSLAAPKVI